MDDKQAILHELDKLLTQSKEISTMHVDFRVRLSKLKYAINKLETADEQTSRLLKTIRDKVVPVQVPYYAPLIQPYYQPLQPDWPYRPWTVTCSGTGTTPLGARNDDYK